MRISGLEGGRDAVKSFISINPAIAGRLESVLGRSRATTVAMWIATDITRQAPNSNVRYLRAWWREGEEDCTAGFFDIGLVVIMKIVNICKKYKAFKVY